MKILLVCSAGMSTTLVIRKMENALLEDEKNWEIDARPVEQFKEVYKDYDVILLAPQIRYKKDELEKLSKSENIPLVTINTIDYGLAKGENILDIIREQIDKK
ncbi:MAG: PTS sugar transporter subunit IIB [Clostridium sp.]|nr:PTS sugar transporter subunit IIB [Clostridium sp.]